MDAGLPRGAIACIDTRHGRLARLWPPAVWTDVPPGPGRFRMREKIRKPPTMRRAALKLSSRCTSFPEQYARACASWGLTPN